VSDSLVIIPTYKEKENIKSIIEAIFALRKNYDVIVIDDNSPDGTADIVKSLMHDFPDRLKIMERSGKLGLGTAYIEGFKYALKHQYEYIFEMDADFSHNPKDLELLYNTCAKDGNDLAIGSRYATGVNVVNWPMGRVLLSYFASLYVQAVTGMHIKDSTAGFVCYRKKVLETINLDKVKFVGYAFQIEMKFTSWKFGFKIQEIPIIFTNRTLGESKMSTGILSEAVFGIIRMKFRSFFKSYKQVAVTNQTE
jgi:dolichol-phosphate mannosyltransferase